MSLLLERDPGLDRGPGRPRSILVGTDGRCLLRSIIMVMAWNSDQDAGVLGLTA